MYRKTIVNKINRNQHLLLRSSKLQYIEPGHLAFNNKQDLGFHNKRGEKEAPAHGFQVYCTTDS